jgi:hypothetical protein
MWFGRPIAPVMGVAVRQERCSREESNAKRKSLNIIGNRFVGCIVRTCPSWTPGGTGLRESGLCGSESGLWGSGLCESGSGLRGSRLRPAGLRGSRLRGSDLRGVTSRPTSGVPVWLLLLLPVCMRTLRLLWTKLVLGRNLYWRWAMGPRLSWFLRGPWLWRPGLLWRRAGLFRARRISRWVR